jgi:putative DNA primase/helicase
MMADQEQRELRSLDERTAKVAEKIAGLKEAQRRGEDVRLGDALALIEGLRDELPAEAVEEWKRDETEQWEQIEAPPLQPAQPKPKLIRRLPRVVPDALPTPGSTKAALGGDEGPQIDAALNVSGKLKAESEDEIIERLEWATAELPSNYSPVLSKQAPLDNARLFTKDKLQLHAVGNRAEGKKSGTGIYFQDGQWWQWNGAFYDRAAEQRMIDMVCGFMDRGKIKSDEGLVRFKPRTQDVNQLLSFLRSNVGLDDRAIPPIWLDGRASPDAANLLAFRNCYVDVLTGKTYDLEPWLLLRDGVDFDYDPAARCPHWQRFLEDIHPGDEEAQAIIEEQLGYGMTIDNQFEKAALWIGKPRSGRGTLAHIQELLVGFNGHTSLNIHTWHNNENSRMGMIGKRVGIFHDMRLKPAKQYGATSYDAGGVDPQSQQLLLELISGDLTEMGRKYLAAWKGSPFIKFILISNKVPNFNDEVLVTRFNVLDFKRSFLGRENPALKKTILPSELPGIANRCLAAYRRLLGRGRFLQAASGLALLSKVKAQVSPWAAFMERYWESDPQGEGTPVRVFSRTFRHWCLETENLELAGTSSSNMIQQIKKQPGWHWLRAYRTGSEPRRYRVKVKAGVTLPKEATPRTDEKEWTED